MDLIPTPWTIHHWSAASPELEGDQAAFVLTSPTFEGWDVQAEDSARLMEAAPELLEALKAFVRGYPGGINDDLNAAARLARAAIAKAGA